MEIALILLALLVVFVIVLLAKTVRIVPQARAGIVERFGKYKGTLPAGLNILMPFIDRLRYLIDLREQVVRRITIAGGAAAPEISRFVVSRELDRAVQVPVRAHRPIALTAAGARAVVQVHVGIAQAQLHRAGRMRPRDPEFRLKK